VGAHLTYRLREGVVVGFVAGRPIRHATLRNQAGMNIAAWRQSSGTETERTTDWPKLQEFRTGMPVAGAPDERLTVTENATLETFDFPGRFAQRFDGVDKGGKGAHRQHARVIWVKARISSGFPNEGVCLHGTPACGNPRCIVITKDWDTLFETLKTVRQLSVFIEL